MRHKYLKALLLAVTISPCLVNATTTEQDFKVNTTQDLVDLCTTSTSDQYYREAIHFCHGYLVGAFHYHQAEHRGPGSTPLVCIPQSEVTRHDAIGIIVAWMQQHPQFMQEPPVETAFRALIEKWPCKS